MKQFRKIVIIIGWLLVWQVVSWKVDNAILLAGPVETVLALIKLLPQGAFWQACLETMLRITIGFFTGTLLGILLAACSARYKLLEEILAPVMAVIKAIPVASFVVIFLIWWGSAHLAAVISFFIVLPNLYINTLEGIKSTDKKLLEMAQVFRIPVWNRFFYIYRMSLKPFWESAIKLTAGMSWKSGVAAEVIGLPAHAIGERLYLSKIYLDTPGVLAWTLVTILLSVGFEQGIMYFWKGFCKWEPACKPVKVERKEKLQPIRLENVSKEYEGVVVVKAMTTEFQPGRIYAFHTPSGSGKTTLFRLLAGLEKPDAGKIHRGSDKIAFLFQEDRLCEEYSALKNVEMVTGNQEMAKEQLLQLLGEEDINKPCSQLSGGMKRRVALARTLAADADILLLDEPYNGLDEENRERVQRCMEKNTKDRIVFLASHIEQTDGPFSYSK